MPDEATLERRLRAVERSLTDGDHDVATVRDAGRLTERVETLETELEDARERIADLEAATQALRGYVGNVRSVNDDVEQRADAALAAVERLERQVESVERRGPSKAQRQEPVPGDSRKRLGSVDRPRPRDPASNETSEDGAGNATTAVSTPDTVSSNGSGTDEDEAGIVERVRELL